MAFYKDYAYVVNGNTVAFATKKSAYAASLPANQGLKLLLHPIQGKISVGVVACDLKLPSRLVVHDTDDANSTPETSITLLR